MPYIVQTCSFGVGEQRFRHVSSVSHLQWRPQLMAHLFESLRLREVTLHNRILVSPMCQYSSRDGLANDWHFVHLGSRAVGRAAAVLTEASAVTADGRISPDDLGIWDDIQIEPLQRI